MKKTLTLIPALLMLTVLVSGFRTKETTTASATPQGSDSASFKWEMTTHNFGKINQNVPTTVTFKFTNAGKKPLIIQNVSSPCGCTVPDYSKEPIMAGKSGSVTLTYNAAHVGVFSKTVTVIANTSAGNQLLTIMGEVMPPPAVQNH